MFKLDLEKEPEEPEIKLPTSVDHQKSKRVPEKSASWEICTQVKKQQLELDMEQQTVPNRERSTLRLYIVTVLI